MNFSEGLRRLIIFVSIIASISGAIFTFMDGSTHRKQYNQLTEAVDSSKLNRKQISANKDEKVKKYLNELKKDQFKDLSILSIEIKDTQENRMVIWHPNGVPKDDEVATLFDNKLYIDGKDFEKETARLLLGYLTGLSNDLSSIDSKTSKLKFEMYLYPILFGAGIFITIWVVFFSVRYVVAGFKK